MTQHVTLDEAGWTTVRTAYESGESTSGLHARFGPSISAITKRAAADGWSRSNPEPLPEIDEHAPTLAEAADLALARARTAVGRGDGPAAARWFRVAAACRVHLRAEAEDARRAAEAPYTEAKALADTVGALAKAHAAGVPEADLTPMLEVLERQFPPIEAKKHALDPAERARLTKARDKARRRGLHKRADELDALLRPP